jgi:uncharacterized secreted protein with C-terminal beta-propeller domain
MTRRAMVLVVVLSTSCGRSGLPAPEPVQQQVALKTFADCTELQQYFADTAVLQMRAELMARRDMAAEGRSIAVGVEDDTTLAAPQAEGGKNAAAATTPSQGPRNWTTTNVQETGVDEPDFVKNDGTRIFVLTGGRLYVNRSWPVSLMATTAAVDIEGWPREMFVDESNRVIVFSTLRYPGYDWWNGADPWGRPACAGRRCDYEEPNAVKVTVVDVSLPASPRVVREEWLPGNYVSARRIGSSVRVVLEDPVAYPPGVRMWVDGRQGLFEDAGDEAALWDELMDRNEEVLRAWPLEKWLPRPQRRLADGSIAELPYDCTSFSRSTAPAELGVVTVATLDLDQPSLAPQRTSLVGRASVVYASAASLYVAHEHWWWAAEDGQLTHTYLHKFDITRPERAVHVASGGIEGVLVDQFSLDEEQGYLRAATTASERRDGEWSSNTVNRVVVLAERNGGLVPIGRTADLALGERIYSARFLGDRGFVVTFRQTDPLFAIDLSDPANPRLRGELKVPGFSTYLHPVDANLLLGVGRDGGTVKLSLFDVADLARPREISTYLIPGYGSSEAESEHKAFNYFPARRTLAIPYVSWDYRDGSFGSELRLFRVDPTSISPLGVLSMADLYSRYAYEWSFCWQPAVRRSVMADDYVYAISDAGIRAARIDQPWVPLQTVLFDRFTE